jgi:hypothetical protein
MKREKKLIEKEVYVASDGTEFNNEYDCKAYEKDLLYKSLNVQKLETDIDYLPFCNCSDDDDSSYTWYYVKNEEELNRLIELYECEVEEIDKYPEWVCIEEYRGEYEDDNYMHKLSDSIEYAKTLLNKLGYTMTVKLKK